MYCALHSETLDLVAEGTDLGVEIGSLVGGEGDGNDRAGDTASTAKSGLGRNVDVRDVLVLADCKTVS